MATLSFHAGTEGKTKRGNLKGVLNHMLRKTMDKHKNHGNELIDPALTKNNIDWTKDKKPVDELVDERLERDYKGKKKLRSDAVVLREIIVQPSPDVFVGLSEAEKRQMAIKFTEDSLKWFDEEFGVENVMAASIHMDETNPHTHVMVMPMTEDGRLSQKDFFKGPAGLKRQHREFREHMNNRGWDFDLENKYENVDGVPLPHYKANAQEIEEKRLEQKRILQELKADPDVRKDAQKAVYSDIYEFVLSDEQKALEDREKALKEREAQLEAIEREQAAEKEALFNRTAVVSGREQDVANAERRLEKQGAVATAVALAVLSGDKKRKAAYEQIEKKGVLAYAPDAVKKTLVDSLEQANATKRQIRTAEIENDGPEL